MSPYLEDVRGPVDLGADVPPPLGVAYESGLLFRNLN